MPRNSTYSGRYRLVRGATMTMSASAGLAFGIIVWAWIAGMSTPLKWRGVSEWLISGASVVVQNGQVDGMIVVSGPDAKRWAKDAIQYNVRPTLRSYEEIRNRLLDSKPRVVFQPIRGRMWHTFRSNPKLQPVSSTQTYFLIPMWIGAAATAIPAAIGPLWLVVSARRYRRRALRGQCVACAYDLTGNVSGRCSECGIVFADVGQ